MNMGKSAHQLVKGIIHMDGRESLDVGFGPSKGFLVRDSD